MAKEKEKYQNIYPPFELDLEKAGWIKLSFVLLEKDWNFGNFTYLVKTDEKLIHIENLLKEKHTMMNKLQIFFDPTREKSIDLSQFNVTLEKIFQTKGEKDSKNAKTITLYYDYEPIYDKLLMF